MPKIFSPTNLEALDASDPYDVCIIGSGPTGTVIATSLANRGIRTVMLESGTGMTQWLVDPKLQKLARYDFSGDTDYPLTKTKARLLGGNSNFWTGRTERLHPSDFELHAYTPPNNPWPITYEELDPYYAQAEKTLRVRGGVRSRCAPPRDESQALLPPKPDNSYLKKLFAKIGVALDDSPSATPTKTYRFFNIQKEVLPKQLKNSKITLVTGATVTKLIVDTDRNVVGAQVQTFGGITKIARAKIYIVACGGIESARLLLLSKSEQYPDGIGNHSDMVGRGFNEHPAVNFYGKINHSLGTLTPTNKITRTHQFYSDYRKEGLGSVLPVMRQAWILPHHVMPFKLSNLPKQAALVFSRFRRATLYIGATIEQTIDDNNRILLSEKNKDYFGNPIAHLHFDYSKQDLKLFDRLRELTLKMYDDLGATDVFESEITWSRHHQGTCRMGDDPKYSVVNKDLRVHGTQNLYVGGCETFVTGGAMQPVLTIVALAHRMADHIFKRLRTAT